jgi:hypothetical protein
LFGNTDIPGKIGKKQHLNNREKKGDISTDAMEMVKIIRL